ncbi:MAG: hypothetical protein IRY99_03875 [Isosphaeraceae bacterium]|nr:hypothetical protein [Isosphaeraceae bacterium]
MDKTKIGVTGRSGGGATSWWIGAIDDRVAAVCPVAGITDLQNHIVAGAPDGPHPHGVVEGHCDCMYINNTYRWDYPTVAALVAPKPLLVENTDKDPIFPEDGVRRIYEQLKKVYQWYDASDRLGLVIGKGGHVDSEEIRHPSFAFFNKWLKGQEGPIEEPDRSFPREVLKVLALGEAPPDCQNGTIHERFVAKAEIPPVPESAMAWEALKGRWMRELKEKVFAGWPAESAATPPEPKVAVDVVREGVRLRGIDYQSQPGIALRLWLFTAAGAEPLPRLDALVLDQEAWDDWSKLISASTAEGGDPSQIDSFPGLKRSITTRGPAQALIVPRGIGPTAWPKAKDTHIRRRFALLGQTLDAMRIWDVRRALAALRTLPELRGADLGLVGMRDAAAWTLWAAVFEPEVKRIVLNQPPMVIRSGPALLNLERILEMPQAVALLYPRPVALRRTTADAWKWSTDLGRALGMAQNWLQFLGEAGGDRPAHP